MKRFIELKTSHYHWLKEETALFANNSCNKCQLADANFFFGGGSYFHGQLFEPYNTSILQTGKTQWWRCGGPQGPRNENGLYSNFSWFSGRQMFRKAGTWLLSEARLLPNQLQQCFPKCIYPIPLSKKVAFRVD